MKHLYKTKEGEILEASVTHHKQKDVWLSDGQWYNLSEVQRVVLDKDGEPFMFEGNPICFEDYIDNGRIYASVIKNKDRVKVYCERGDERFGVFLDNLHQKGHTHTPKHPQKKGIEKTLVDDNKQLRDAGCELAEAALYTVREYDGLHRLCLAVSKWSQAVADEGGRDEVNKLKE